MSSIVTLNEDYTQAAIALFGNTKPFLSEIKNIGGIFNARLKYNGSSAPGWIFPKTKLQVVRQLVNKINSGDIKPQDTEPTNDDKRKESYTRASEKSEKNEKSTEANVVLSKQEFKYIMNTLTKLTQEVTELKRKVFPDSMEARRPQSSQPKKVVKEEVSEDDDEEEEDDDEEEEEEVVQPKKGPSFLRKK